MTIIQARASLASLQPDNQIITHVRYFQKNQGESDNDFKERVISSIGTSMGLPVAVSGPGEKILVIPSHRIVSVEIEFIRANGGEIHA